jgi:hypothetical protein
MGGSYVFPLRTWPGAAWPPLQMPEEGDRGPGSADLGGHRAASARRADARVGTPVGTASGASHGQVLHVWHKAGLCGHMASPDPQFEA